jgi:hypothetical protein
VFEGSSSLLSCLLTSFDPTDRRSQAFVSASRQDWYISSLCQGQSSKTLFRAMTLEKGVKENNPVGFLDVWGLEFMSPA